MRMPDVPYERQRKVQVRRITEEAITRPAGLTCHMSAGNVEVHEEVGLNRGCEQCWFCAELRHRKLPDLRDSPQYLLKISYQGCHHYEA